MFPCSSTPDSNDQLVTSLYWHLITTHSFESGVLTSKTAGRWPVSQDWRTLLHRFSMLLLPRFAFFLLIQQFCQNANCPFIYSCSCSLSCLFVFSLPHSFIHSFIHSSYKRSRSEPQLWELHVMLTEVTKRTTAHSFTHSFCLFVFIAEQWKSLALKHQRPYMTLTL